MRKRKSSVCCDGSDSGGASGDASMAARKKLWHPDIVRQRIRVSQLLNRLNNHAAGKCEMSQTQVRAAEILLKKSLPDLSSVEMTGEGGGPLQIVQKVYADRDPE